MTITTKHNIKGETIWISADFNQATNPIYATWFDPSDAEYENSWQPTPFQVADAQHNQKRAARLVADWAKYK